jgi:hypothetical protein
VGALEVEDSTEVIHVLDMLVDFDPSTSVMVHVIERPFITIIRVPDVNVSLSCDHSAPPFSVVATTLFVARAVKYRVAVGTAVDK